jgi:hypothetical protein
MVSKRREENEELAAAGWHYLEAVKKHAPERFEAERRALQHKIPLAGPRPLKRVMPPEYDPAWGSRASALRRYKEYMKYQEDRRRAQGFVFRTKGLPLWGSRAFEALALFDLRGMSQEEVGEHLGLPKDSRKQHAAKLIHQAAKMLAPLGFTLRKPLPGIKKKFRSPR